MDFFTKRLRYTSIEHAYRDLLTKGVIDESALNIGGTFALVDVPGGDFLLLHREDIYFENEVTYFNSLTEYIGGRPNDRG